MKYVKLNNRRWLNRAIQESARDANRAPWLSPLTKAAFRTAMAKRLQSR